MPIASPSSLLTNLQKHVTVDKVQKNLRYVDEFCMTAHNNDAEYLLGLYMRVFVAKPSICARYSHVSLAHSAKTLQAARDLVS